MSADLCTDFDTAVLRYIPNEPYIRYYVNCSGLNPFQNATDYVENIIKTNNTKNHPLEQYKVLNNTLYGMKCNMTRDLYYYEKGLICLNMMNNFSIQLFCFFGIAFLLLVIAIFGLTETFSSADAEYTRLHTLN